ncbi:Cytochrome P450 4C1 [Orchesella cincta]|uniref:Cytochrome P450 4C1 n=1 Tax=Orchesella cincta TaxID=48709 RepID=A0A1D2MA21_ORCCI|nr:Cytochrome P450 4C1 [Orchesella cincta]
MESIEAQTILKSGLVTSFLVLSVCLLLVKAFTQSYFGNKSITKKLRKNKQTAWEKLPKFPIFRGILLLLDLRSAIEKYSRLAEGLGPVFRVMIYGEEFAILTNPSAIQKLLSSKDEGHIVKSPKVYQIIKDMTGNGLVMSSGQLWHTNRKLFAKAFSYSALKTYMQIYNKCASRLTAKLERIGEKHGFSEYQKINWIIHECGFDVITETVMGLDQIVNKEDSALMFTNLNSAKNAAMIKQVFNAQPWLAPLFQLHPSSIKYRKSLYNIDSIIKKMITQFRHRAGEDKDADEDSFENMLAFMLKSGLAEDVILAEVKTMLLAGYETTSSTIHYLFFMLALHQNHQNACREEILRVFDKCPDGQLTMEALSELKYLERCIQETLRLFPVIFTIARKLETPLIIGNGSNVAVSILQLHRSPEYFPNPDEFQPERFLPENCMGRHSFAYVPFSSGPRSCIGMKFALLEAKTIAAHVLKEFELYTSDTMKSVPNMPSILLKPERAFYFLLKKRSLS